MKTLALAMAITLSAGSAVFATDAPKEHLKSLDAKQIDNTIAPGSDFYLHVNKKWMDENPLTPEYARYGKFNILSDSSEARVKDIVLNLAATNPQPGTVAFKVSTIYNQAMDLRSPQCRRSQTNFGRSQEN